MIEREIEKTLEELRHQHLWREFRSITSAQGPEITIGKRKVICFCSNNYLNFASDPSLQEEAIQAIRRFGFGAGASRYISGNSAIYPKLEQAAAKYKKKEAALVFPTGYQANVGAISALCRDSTVFSDQLNHASLIDGIRMAKAKVVVYPHGDVQFLKKALARERMKKKWVITDSIFSMDGDGAPLKEIVALKEKYGFGLYVDDAHATGVLGPQGRGYVCQLGLEEQVDVIIATFSKALGGLGGFVAASQKIISFLRNRCRSLIYTTALPPVVLAFNLAAIKKAKAANDRRKNLMETTHRAYQALKTMGLEVKPSISPILPLIVGSSEEALKLSRKLYRKGVFVPAIRPPTVPKGTARLRLSFMSAHTQKHLDQLLEAFHTG